MFKPRTEGMKKALKFFFLVYIAVSVLYTMKYFYVDYLKDDNSKIKQRDNSEWGSDKLSWKSRSGK
jgi:hypothetical protein